MSDLVRLKTAGSNSKKNDGVMQSNSRPTLVVNLPEMTLEPNIPLPPLSLQVLRDSLVSTFARAECCDLAYYAPRITAAIGPDVFRRLFRANREHRLLRPDSTHDLELPPECLDAVEASGLVDRFLQVVERHDPILVGLSLQGTPQSSDLFATGLCKVLARALRRRHPGVDLVIGGARTVEKENVRNELMAEPAVTYLVRGNGHRSLPQLVTRLEGGTIDPSQVRGLIYRTDAGLGVANEADPPWGHMAVPIWLDRDALPHYRRTLAELAPRARHVPWLSDKLDQSVCVAPFQFTVGCVSECAFCNRASEAGRVSRPKDVVDNLETAVKEYGIHDFLFLNSELNFGRTYVHRFCDELSRRNLDLRWIDSCEFRGLDAETLTIMRDAGCVGLWFGIESPSGRMLEYIQKRITAAHATRMLYEANRLGIYNCLNFICGMPYEREEDVETTLTFFRDHNEIFDTAQVNIFYLQGGPFVDTPERFGLAIRGHQEQVGSTMCRAFDEVREGGLRWEDKKKQMLSSFGRVAALHSRLFPDESRNMLLVIALHRATGGDKRKMRAALRHMTDPGIGDFLNADLKLARHEGVPYLLDMRREEVLCVDDVVARSFELRQLGVWTHVVERLRAEFSAGEVDAAIEAIARLEAQGFFPHARQPAFVDDGHRRAIERIVEVRS